MNSIVKNKLLHGGNIRLVRFNRKLFLGCEISSSFNRQYHFNSYNNYYKNSTGFIENFRTNNFTGTNNHHHHHHILGSSKIKRSKSSMAEVNDVEEARIKERFQARERRFETPYGHIAGLEWGNSDAPNKILCVHGWLDNAGSFERLVPFLLNQEGNSNKYHIISLDLPGVGLSSHKPPGADYSLFTYVMDMRRVTMQLKWDKLTLLAHSLGSHISYMYCCIYPNQIESLISVDLSHPIARTIRGWNLAIANSIEDFFKCEYQHKDEPETNIRVPVYSEQDALKRLMAGHSNSLTLESAKALLKRGTEKHSWGYTFRRDIRLRHLSLELRPDDELTLQYLADTFHPNLMIIRANQSPYQRPEEVRLRYYDFFKKNCPVFRDVQLDGTHHLHLNNPEIVAPEISKFLLEVQSSIQNDIRLDKSNL